MRAFCLILIAGCAAGPELTVCEKAVDKLAECTGEAVPDDLFGDDCAGDDREQAEASLAAGCDALSDKSDGFFCSGVTGFVLRKLGLCELPLLFDDPASRQLGGAEFPIVLHHGLAAGPGNGWGFIDVPEALGGDAGLECGPEPLHATCFSGGGDGHQVYFGTVPPFESVEERAADLAKHIDQALEHYGAQKVHLITMSLGGLDARHVISQLGFGDRVASLTSLHGEHHGTRVADVALKLIAASDDTVVETALNDLASIWGTTFNADSTSSDLLRILSDLSEASAAQFNRDHPNDSRVQYITWAAVSRTAGRPYDEQRAVEACGGAEFAHWHPQTWAVTRPQLSALAFLHGDGVPNDGIASVSTARGFPDPDPTRNGDNFQFRGCVPGDHMDLMNSNQPDKESGFDHVRFLRNVAFDIVELERGL